MHNTVIALAAVWIKNRTQETEAGRYHGKAYLVIQARNSEGLKWEGRSGHREKKMDQDIVWAVYGHSTLNKRDPI